MRLIGILLLKMGVTIALAQHLSVTPVRALLDEPVTITLTDLSPHDAVTLRAQLTDDEGITWRSYAVFEADADGVVDVASQAPLTGSYQGVDPLGLLWSMQPERAPLAGIFFHDSLEPLRVSFTAAVDGQAVADAEVERLAIAPDVTRTNVRDHGLIGTLFGPPARGHFRRCWCWAVLKAV